MQELAFVFACNVAYLEAMEAAHIPLDQAQGMVYAWLAADADQFLTMAKFRAPRLLWARIEQACGLIPRPLFIAADTAWRMLTQRYPYVNMMRATMATFAAGLAGANALTVLPHTLALGLPIHLRVASRAIPSSCCWRKATSQSFRSRCRLRLHRGINSAALRDGLDYSRTAKRLVAPLPRFSRVCSRTRRATRKARDANIARRREVLTSASEFPNLHESEAVVLTATPVALASYGELKYKFDALAPIRLAEPFEALRDKSDAALKARDARPRVFLANLGTPTDYTAQAISRAAGVANGP